MKICRRRKIAIMVVAVVRSGEGGSGRKCGVRIRESPPFVGIPQMREAGRSFAAPEGQGLWSGPRFFDILRTRMRVQRPVISDGGRRGRSPRPGPAESLTPPPGRSRAAGRNCS